MQLSSILAFTLALGTAIANPMAAKTSIPKVLSTRQTELDGALLTNMLDKYPGSRGPVREAMDDIARQLGLPSAKLKVRDDGDVEAVQELDQRQVEINRASPACVSDRII
jgi:hypothetical protein